MGRLRRRVKALSKRAREGDVAALRALLAHSVDMGHGKLAVRRLLLARAMGAGDLGEASRYCARVIAGLPSETVLRMESEARREAQRHGRQGRPDG